jgi:steroid delta-isomerase-like uncharacterized protein
VSTAAPAAHPGLNCPGINQREAPKINQVADPLPRRSRTPCRHERQQATQEPTMTTSHQNATTVLDMLDAIWNRGDLSVLDTSVAEDHIDHDNDGEEIGREHLAQGIQEYRDAFPDLRMSFDEQIADGDRVVTRWTASGTHRGALQGIPATGRSARISGVFIHRLSDGIVTESWTSFDRLGLLQQLGVIPALAAA